MPNRSLHVARTELARNWAALRNAMRMKGPLRLGARITSIAAAQLAFPVIRAQRRNKTFVFRGQQLGYTVARYNNSFLNERTVEVSIAKWFLDRHRGRLLEVGNVLSHYGVSGHFVVDRDERIPGVVNEDLLTFVANEPFDIAVAISTLEHIGWDDTPQTPSKVYDALRALRSCVRDGGNLLVTLPIGYNAALDDGLRTGMFALPVESWLMRRTASNEWVECDRQEAVAKRYGAPYPGANALYIATLA